MPAGFFSFPGEIRNRIYKYLLVVPGVIRIIQEYMNDSRNLCLLGGRPRPSPAILLANTATHREASPILYSRNKFRFGDECLVDKEDYERERALFALFLDQIGPNNARFLRNIRIAFPAYNDLGRGDVDPRETSVSILNLIRIKCTGLAVLEVCLSYNPASGALPLVHSHLSSIPSLKEVRVITHDGLLDADLMTAMRDWGWTVELMVRRQADNRFCLDTFGRVSYYRYLYLYLWI
ncbi:hypothetical protein VTK56DRAFT_4980 [Thermocarpiscus australiensis]